MLEPVFPAILGYEAAGAIDAIGAGVGGLSIGGRVSVIPSFMFDQYGLYGDLMVAPARAAVKLPDNVSFASVDNLWRRSGVRVASLVEVAEADGMRESLGLARREALWAIRRARRAVGAAA